MPEIALQQSQVNKSQVTRPAEHVLEKAGPVNALDPITSYQQAFGNQAVQRMLRTKVIQAKLVVNPPDDEYEKEADQVADAVMRMPEPVVQRSCPRCKEDERVQTAPLVARITPLVQRQAVPEEEEDEAVQAKAADGGTLQRQEDETEEEKTVQIRPLSGQDAMIQREEAPEDEDKKKKDEEAQIQTNPLSGQGIPLIQREANAGAEDKQKKKDEGEEFIQTKLLPGQASHIQRESRDEGLQARIEAPSSGRLLALNLRREMEATLGADLSHVRVHDSVADQADVDKLNAKAFTHGDDIWIGSAGSAEDRKLIAHELTHVVQQGRTLLNSSWLAATPSIQCESNPSEKKDDRLTDDRFTGPLTDGEWNSIELWQSRGEVGIGEPLTDNPDDNALVVAGAIFCNRARTSLILEVGDPLLCIVPEATRADPRVKKLKEHVTQRGPIKNYVTYWPSLKPKQRELYIMERLVTEYRFPVNGAAGLVGNMYEESARTFLPNIIQGGNEKNPMKVEKKEYTAEEAMTRWEGIGLVQWTDSKRRAGLFRHSYKGQELGASILFNMDAQIDYMVNELTKEYSAVYNTLTREGVSLNDASDDVAYIYEGPNEMRDASGKLLKREDPAVQGVFRRRRTNSETARRVYLDAHP